MFHQSRAQLIALGALFFTGLAANASTLNGRMVAEAQTSALQAALGQSQAQAVVAKAQALAARAQLAQTKELQKYTASELRRVRLNSERLLKMNPTQGRRVAAVIADLEGHKLRPLIDVQVFRTPAQQRALVAKGYSKTLFSFHNAYRLDPRTGKVLPDSLAADIVDFDRQWRAPKSFWLKLNSAALAHSSTTGIDWGLSTKNRQRLALAVATKEWSYPGPLGWDVAHTQPRGLTIPQAKRGVRPQ